MSVNGENDGAWAVEQSRKKKVRGGHRAHLKKMSGEIDGLLGGDTLASEPRLITLKGCLERKAQIISKLDEEVLEEIPDDDITLEIEEAEDVQTHIQEMIVAIEKAVIRNPIKSEKAGTSRSSESRPVSPRAGFKHMKLPKYEIKFGGDPKQYRTFIDSFEVSVMKSNELSDVQRFTYL